MLELTCYVKRIAVLQVIYAKTLHLSKLKIHFSTDYTRIYTSRSKYMNYIQLAVTFVYIRTYIM